MPRNPGKKRCAIPGCRNWAMRNHDRCRPHRDTELGPQGAGAPPANLNALKTGAHAHPLPEPELENLVQVALERPQDLPYLIGYTIHSIQNRTKDTFFAIIAAHALLAQFESRVAAHLADKELQDMLHPLSSPSKIRFQLVFSQHLTRLEPVKRLLTIRKMKKELEQLLEQGSKKLVENNHRNRDPTETRIRSNL